MNVHFSYRVNKTPDLEREINHLIEKLGKRLHAFRPELVHLKGTLEENHSRKTPVVSLNLRLPSGQMAVQESADTAVAAIKAAADDLLHQLAKHKELLRNSHKWRGRRRPGSNRHESQVPFETTVAAVQAPIISVDDIRSYVNANLNRLELFIEREIYFREAAEQIAHNSVSKQEVIDETIARALGDDGERPERLALEPWLFRIALRVIGDLGFDSNEDGSTVHLEQQLRRHPERASDEPQLQFHQPDESFTEETILADRRAATPEAMASSDEMIRLVHYAMTDATPIDREAFILYAIEGFMVDEVAAITDRKAHEVLSSISLVRERLRRSPPIVDHFRDHPRPGSAAD
jgi:DNA-directed RNA polymerase specialized sigma24 family protein/ribosome-associated translation inhibitor RaiA